MAYICEDTVRPGLSVISKIVNEPSHLQPEVTLEVSVKHTVPKVLIHHEKVSSEEENVNNRILWQAFLNKDKYSHEEEEKVDQNSIQNISRR